MEKYALDFFMAAAEQIPLATVIIVVYLCYLAIKKAWSWYRDTYKQADKHFEEKRQEKERNAMVYQNHNDIENLAHKHAKDTHMFEDRFNDIETSMKNCFEDVLSRFDVLTKQITEQQMKTDMIKQRELRNQIVRDYEYYTGPGKDKWNSRTAEMFFDEVDSYESVGGNGFVHDVIVPEMRELELH